MSKWTHFKVLLKKNFITLRRNLCFAIFFLVLPIITMGIFTIVKALLSDGNTPEKHNLDQLYFTSTEQFNVLDTSSIQFADIAQYDYTKYSSTLNCVYPKLLNFTIIADDTTMVYFQNTIDYLKSNKMVQYPAKTRAEVFEIISTTNVDTFCFALQVNTFNIDTDEYDFEVSYLRQNIPDTNVQPFDIQIRSPTYNNWNKYKNTGYLGIYQLIMNAIFEAKQKTGARIDMAYVPMKTPSFNSVDPSVSDQLSQNFPFFFMFTFLIPLYYLVSKLSEEKESKSREGMKMMGLKDTSYFLSWLVFYATIVFFMSIVIMAMLSINVFFNSNKFLIFIMAFFYGLSLFGFSVVIVAILPSQRASATAASLLHIITYFLVFVVKDPDTVEKVKVIMSIFPNIGMSFCIYNLYHFESDSTGLSFSNASLLYQNITFNAALLALVFDTVFYLVLGIYLDQIIPSQYGVARKWYFLCTRNFWCERRRRNNRPPGRDTNDAQVESLLINSDVDIEQQKNPEDFEAVPEILRRQEVSNDCLQIRGLRKQFGDKVAVDNTNMTMYNGQIFALLGHNGAGKTTTISMLTGLFEPNKGKASVFGIDIFNEMDEMRKILGVCPQHDVLFEFLTPKEHLALFASFKGTPQNQISELVDKMIKDIDLISAQDQLAKTLSGGQKRKLSVGCAMIGNSKIVILDEPTSGMDTSSRRRLWEMLKENKNGRIVILTTHYMDEADILGDRIGIMADGKVKCCGSSLFLKNRYGVGYNLVIAKKTRDPAPQIDEYLFSRIEGVKKLQEVSSEMTFQLPSAASSQFKEFFNQLDNNLDQLGIRSYGVGITTLEEVFLKIGKGEANDDDEDEEMKKFTLEQMNKKNKVEEQAELLQTSQTNELDDYSIAEQHETDPFVVFTTNLRALLKKKFLLQIRDSRTLLIELVFPIAFIFAGLGLATIKFLKDGHPRYMTPAIFPSPNPLFSNSPYADTFVNSYFHTLNASEWTVANKVALDTPSNTNYEQQLLAYDDALFTFSETTGQAVFGDYYYYKIDSVSDQYAVFTFSNATSQDAVAAYAAAAYEAILKDVLAKPNAVLKFTSTPFPLTLRETSVLSAAAGTTSSLLFSIAFMMISNSLITNIIAERRRNVKNQMIISGASIPAYWMSHYIVDIIFQAPPSICIIIGIQAFSLDIPQAWIIVIIFIFANPVFVYALSFLFENEGGASIITRLIYILLGGIVPLAVQFLEIFPSTVTYGKVFRWFFYIFPIFSLNFGVQNIASRKVFAVVEDRTSYDPLDINVAGPSVIFMFVDIIFYWLLVSSLEQKFWQYLKFNYMGGRRRMQQLQQNEEEVIEDEDIVEEEERVAKTQPEQNTVRLNRVKKYYGKTLAVEKVSFGLEYGECFALLGVSGAGKTTTFKCLIGEETPSSGEVAVNGFDVTTRRGFEKARKLIGYCPQFDAIFDGMTVREHLEFYAAVKGVLRQYRQQIVERQLDEMDLREYQSVRAEKLSGGNKRKLSVAMAMIGNPPIVFLDEPSTGVDPKAKRFMWTIVSKISTMRKKSSVIITTHSMEEAEALCTKMGIMVAGRFKCFGSSQHIKAKYGTGYEIEVKIRFIKQDELDQIKVDNEIEDLPVTFNQIEGILNKLNAGDLMSEITKDGVGRDLFDQLQNGSGTLVVDDLVRWAFTESRGAAIVEKFEQMFQQVEVLEHYNNSYKIKVSRDNYSIGYLFGMMEDIKGEYQISEYSVSQTTLEQIFNNFAREAEKGNQRQRTTVKRKTKKNQPDLLERGQEENKDKTQ